MGFHAVSVGNSVGEHGCIDQRCLSLLFKSVKYLRKDNKNYALVEFQDDIDPLDHNMCNMERVQERYLRGYDDMNLDGDDELQRYALGDLLSKMEIYITFEDESFRVGSMNTCDFVIGLGCVGDDLGGEDGPVVVSYQRMQIYLKMIKWLYDSGRISSTDISIIGNCCS